jgi:hypothetical protein
MEVVDFKIEHFDRMELLERGWQRREDRSIFANYPRLGPSYTLLDGDIPIISGGFAMMWSGVCDSWMLVSKHMERYPLSVYRTVSATMEAVIEKYKLYRIQTIIKEDDNKAINWIERLGFTREGVLRQFGPDKKNYLMYGRIF